MHTAVGLPPVYLSFEGVIDYLMPVLTQKAEPEQILADRLKGRDQLALSDVYELYSRPVFIFINRFTGDRNSAEDIQQQVFLEVWQKASKFDPGRGSMLTWIMTIARSRALDHARRRVPEPIDPSSAATMAESARGSVTDIERAIDDWHFSQLISSLPEHEAEVLRYRFDGELSQSEISDRTGIPLGTVKSRMVSALERLRSQIEANR
ncbi:MAG: sigma-70 family RNA polymerase sigma factor [Solirubrobacterales bacterium]